MFMDLHKVLGNKNLQNNFDAAIDEIKSRVGDSFIEPDINLQDILDQIHTTHTFDFEASKSILFHQKALLSQQQWKNMGIYKEEVSTNLGEGEILSNYVFAYLGIHDPYYSWDKERNIYVPAFGAFLPSSIGDKYNANATRRDLSSPQSLSDKSKEFLSTVLARTYAAYQIANEHENFWDYWGDYNYIDNNATYLDDLWKWKIEFHYLDKVNCCDFAALLWPVEKIYKPNRTSINSDIINEIKGFKKDNPNVIVYPYIWDSRYPRLSFCYASFLITDFFYSNLEYITSENFTIKFEKWKK
jgi:hypothetical protein